MAASGDGDARAVQVSRNCGPARPCEVLEGDGGEAGCVLRRSPAGVLRDDLSGPSLTASLCPRPRRRAGQRASQFRRDVRWPHENPSHKKFLFRAKGACCDLETSSPHPKIVMEFSLMERHWASPNVDGRSNQKRLHQPR